MGVSHWDPWEQSDIAGGIIYLSGQGKPWGPPGEALDLTMDEW